MERIGFIGAGKVGKAFGAYLNKTGYEDITYYKRGTDLRAFVDTREILFITTNDDAIETMSNALAASGTNLEGKLVLHCSGALSSSILSACASAGAITFSLHPLQAFIGDTRDVETLGSTFLTAESNDQNKRILLTPMLERMGNPCQWIDTDAKTLYHASAVMLSNYLVTLINEGYEYLKAIGIDQDTADRMMQPLIRSSIDNVQAKGTVDGLTGPIVRGDEGVIRKHMDAVNKTLGDNHGTFYRIMGDMTVDMIKGKRLDDRTGHSLKELFKE